MTASDAEVEGNHHDQRRLTGALIQAADGEPEWVQALLEAGADPNGMPLIMAIQCQEPAIVEMMLHAGADVNAPFSDTTPLNRAISSSNPIIVELLIRAGAQVNQAAPDGLLPLTVARHQHRTTATVAEREQIIDLLIKSGAREQDAGDA